jgi:hypothetical protein
MAKLMVKAVIAKKLPQSESKWNEHRLYFGLLSGENCPNVSQHERNKIIEQMLYCDVLSGKNYPGVSQHDRSYMYYAEMLYCDVVSGKNYPSVSQHERSYIMETCLMWCIIRKKLPHCESTWKELYYGDMLYCDVLSGKNYHGVSQHDKSNIMETCCTVG